MDIREMTHEDVLSHLPDREADSHKGSFGKVLLLCGSCGYTGAAALAAMGALRTGAGLVYLGVPECIYAIEAGKLLEPIVFPLPEQEGKLSADCVGELTRFLCKMDAVLIGPGLGQSEGTEYVLNWLLENYNGPLVVDADGINVLKPHMDVVRGRTSPTVLTPHEGEFRRLYPAANGDRMSRAAELGRDLGATVVLKGHKTVITDGEHCYVNPTGNPGMAVGGSGDVLAGMIVSLLGQKLDPLTASACAVWLHGAAGDICARELGQYGMLPSDMLKVLPRLMK